MPHDDDGDEGDWSADACEVEQEGEVHEHGKCSLVGGGVWVEGLALGVDRWLAVLLVALMVALVLLMLVFVAHDPLFQCGGIPARGSWGNWGGDFSKKAERVPG